jgi:hypothetical protein
LELLHRHLRAGQQMQAGMPIFEPILNGEFGASVKATALRVSEHSEGNNAMESRRS